MTGAVRAEWLKLVTTRVFTGLLCGAAVAGVLFAFLGAAQGPPPWDVTEPLRTGTAWGFGVLTVTVLAVLVGSRTVTDEFASDTVVHTFLADPGRRRSILAKSAVAALAAMAIAAVAATAVGGTVYAMAAVTGGNLVVYVSDATAVLGLIGAAGVLGVLGTGLGALVRHPVPAIVAALLWLFVAENVAGLLAGPVAGYLPGKLAANVAGVPQTAGALPPVVAVVLLAAGTAALVAVAIAEVRRRDVL